MCMDIICEQICKVASGFALLENLNPTLFLHLAALASFPTNLYQLISQGSISIIGFRQRVLHLSRFA
jgi:hypothetical protein